MFRFLCLILNSPVIISTRQSIRCTQPLINETLLRPAQMSGVVAHLVSRHHSDADEGTLEVSARLQRENGKMWPPSQCHQVKVALLQCTTTAPHTLLYRAPYIPFYVFGGGDAAADSTDHAKCRNPRRFRTPRCTAWAGTAEHCKRSPDCPR